MHYGVTRTREKEVSLALYLSIGGGKRVSIGGGKRVSIGGGHAQHATAPPKVPQVPAFTHTRLRLRVAMVRYVRARGYGEIREGAWLW
jgi:hypothetical protein